MDAVPLEAGRPTPSFLWNDGDALNQLLDITTAFPFLNLYFSIDRFSFSFELFFINYFPWSASPRVRRTACIMVINTLFDIFRPANVISIKSFTVKNVHVMHCGRCRARTYDLPVLPIGKTGRSEPTSRYNDGFSFS